MDLLHGVSQAVSIILGHPESTAVVPGAGNRPELGTCRGFGAGHWRAAELENGLLWQEMFYILKGLGTGRPMNQTFSSI